MSIKLPDIEAGLRNAVRQYWSTLAKQAKKQRAGKEDHGQRAAVTGGKQMDGFADLVRDTLLLNGVSEQDIHQRKKAIPGFFRPTKDWDLLVVHKGHLLAAVEFKSHRGPSFGNNFNNRTEEALGIASDIWTAYREGAFGHDGVKPWLGWIMLLEDTAKSTTPVKVVEPHFAVFPEFRNTSYAERYQIQYRKLKLEKLYDGAALVMAPESGKGIYSEPLADLSMRRFLASLAGHVASTLVSMK
ncbi:MAG: restriction endonuclease [Deltaproteobacteria bacterium]|nr:restriction endonuclease [Deltaproteobacteria bacterium]